LPALATVYRAYVCNRQTGHGWSVGCATKRAWWSVDVLSNSRRFSFQFSAVFSLSHYMLFTQNHQFLIQVDC